MKTSRYPSLYQINTRVWLTGLSRELGRPATLDDIPDAELDRLAEMGFDWIWFLSVWQTGAASQRISCSNSNWRKEFQETLPDLCEEDIPGSGFAITGYTTHCGLGGDAALARLAQAAFPARPAAIVGLRSQSHGPGPPLGRGSPRVLHPRHGTGFGADAAKLHLDQAQTGRPPAGTWARPLLPRLARYASTQLRQSGHAGSNDRRASEDRRPVRRRALRHGHAGAAGSF